MIILRKFSTTLIYYEHNWYMVLLNVSLVSCTTGGDSGYIDKGRPLQATTQSERERESEGEREGGGNSAALLTLNATRLI